MHCVEYHLTFSHRRPLLPTALLKPALPPPTLSSLPAMVLFLPALSPLSRPALLVNPPLPPAALLLESLAALAHLAPRLRQPQTRTPHRLRLQPRPRLLRHPAPVQTAKRPTLTTVPSLFQLLALSSVPVSLALLSLLSSKQAIGSTSLPWSLRLRLKDVNNSLRSLESTA